MSEPSKSALSELGNDLKEYWALPHHHNLELGSKLADVQAWQKDRMRDTHHDLFSQPKNKPMAEYFLNNLYGGSSLDEVVSQLDKILPKAQKIEKITPAAALDTGALGIRTAIKSTKLDLAIAQWLLTKNLEVNQSNMHAAYQAVDSADERRQQIEDLRQVCYRSDKYLKSFILQKAFKMTKNKAEKHNFQPLYGFIDSGFNAMKPLKSVSQFIDPFCEQELHIIEAVHSEAVHSKNNQ